MGMKGATSDVQLLKLCAEHLEEGDLLEAEIVLDEFFRSPHVKPIRPLEEFTHEALEKLGVLFLTMRLLGSPASVVIWNELRSRGMTNDEIAEEFELDCYADA